MLLSSAKHRNWVTVLDIGTSKIVCLIVRFEEETPIIEGMGYTPAQGIKNGAIVDLDKATACISKALSMAEKNANRTIESVIVNISSAQLKSVHLREMIHLKGSAPITTTDVKKFVDTMIENYVQETEEEIVHAFVLGYNVDGEMGILDPRGLFAKKLGVHLHLITLPKSHALNLVNVLDGCHVTIESKVATPYASALSVLTDDEKEIGVASIDIGAGATQIALFLKGYLVHLGLVPMAGNLITRDIAQGLSCTLADAERLKVLNGAAFLSPKDELERLIVPIIGENDTTASLQVPCSDLISIIVPRLEEILDQTEAILTAQPLYNICAQRLVLTGGSSGLAEIKEKITAYLKASVRFGNPEKIKGLNEQLDINTFSTCIGLIKYAIIKDKAVYSYAPVSQFKEKQGIIRKIAQWFAQIF